MSIILFSVLAFFTPLLFGSPTHETFEFPKMYFVYIMGGIVLWLFLIGKNKIVFPSREIVAFVLFYGISTALSIHKYTSVWGYYKRFNGGLISALVFAGLFVVMVSIFKRAQIKEFIDYTALTAIPVSVLAIFQHYGPNSVTRAYSTFGQANWLAAFLVMTAFVALSNFLEAKKRNEVWFWAGVFILSFWGTWISYSTSGVLAFLIAGTIFLVLNKSVVRQRLKHFIFLSAVILVIAVSNPGIFAGKIRDIFIDLKKVYAQDEQIENAVSDPGFIRTELWAGTVKLWYSNPKIMLFGTGPETYPYAFQEFRPASLNYSSEWDFVFNKPHNYYLELLSTVGILGTAAYLFVMKRSLIPADRVFAPVLIGFYVTNLFGWPTVTTALFFWMILAWQEAKE